jgi:enamine deaminase RidA (YjgF/YER057c/UK114 family)
MTHRTINPESLPRPWGFSHAVVAAAGTTVYVAGQTATRPDGTMPEDLVAQFDAACDGVTQALHAAAARPEHVVSMQIFTTALAEYVARAKEVGERYRSHFGRHYPAMALIEVKGLVGGAKVEIMCTAQVPDGGTPTSG